MMANSDQAPLTVDGLMAAAFNRPRDPRSDAYKQGVRDGLTRILNGTVNPMPYKSGTAESDAILPARMRHA